jgi:hypothetical protein
MGSPHRMAGLDGAGVVVDSNLCVSGRFLAETDDCLSGLHSPADGCARIGLL